MAYSIYKLKFYLQREYMSFLHWVIDNFLYIIIFSVIWWLIMEYEKDTREERLEKRIKEVKESYEKSQQIKKQKEIDD